MVPSLVIAVLGLSGSAITLNTILLFLIFRKSKVSVLNLLIANLALVINFGAVFGAFFLSGLDKKIQKRWICSLFSYSRNTITDLISLSVLAISYERVRGMRSCYELVTSRIVTLIWTTSLLAALPSWFTTDLYSHTHKDGKEHFICLKTHPLDNFALGFVYEVLRAFTFHVCVAMYLIYELYKLRSKLRYFFKNPASNNTKLQKKAQRIRFIYANSITFILIWVPFGVGTAFYKTFTLQGRYDAFMNNLDEDGWKDKETSDVFYILMFLFYSYILLLPGIIFITNMPCKCVQKEPDGTSPTNGGACGDDNEGGTKTYGGDTTVQHSSEE